MHIGYTPQNEEEARQLELDAIAGANAEYELAASDYIIVKISEANADGDNDEIDRIRREHAGTIARRKQLRKMINDIKAKWEH